MSAPDRIPDVERAILVGREMKREPESFSLNKALDRAYRYLSYRARSTCEVRDYLTKKGHSEAVVDEAIERLGEYGYLDDSEFARQLVRAKSDWGQRRLWHELRKKGIETSIIEDAMLSQVDEEHRCRRLASGYLCRLGTELDLPNKRRLWAYLVRRGFTRESIESAIRWAEREVGRD